MKINKGQLFTYGGSRYVFDSCDADGDWLAHSAEAAHQVFTFTPELQKEVKLIGSAPAPARLKEFTKPVLREMRVDIDLALAAVAEKYGIRLAAGNCSFMPGTASFKIQAAVYGDNGEPLDRRHGALQDYADIEGLRPEHLKPEFRFNHKGSPYSLVGYNPRSSKWPFIVRNEQTKKQYKFARSLLVEPLGLKVGGEINGR